MGNNNILDPSDRSRLPQLDFFEILDPNDVNYSQAIELYDSLPKYVFSQKHKAFDEDNTEIVRDFVNRGRDYQLRINGAILTKKGRKIIAYPSRREEIVEDALRKLTVSANRTYYADGGTWCEFTLHELQKELANSGHSYDKNEIKEALNICHQTRIEVTANGKKITSGYMLPSLTLVSAADLKENKDARCVVRFHEMVTTAIKDLSFRQFNYQLSMSFSYSLSRALLKRLSYNWRQARIGNSYGPVYLSTVFRDSGRDLNNKMSVNRKFMEQALNELITNKVLIKFTDEKIMTGRKISDIKYTFNAHPDFIRDIKRFNHFESQARNSLQGTETI